MYMYTRNDLSDINCERARLIEEAITQLKKQVVSGIPYTARDLSRMTGGIISSTIFGSSLRRGYRILRKREEKNPLNKHKYSLFGDWRAKCVIHKEGVRIVTIKEYDEDGNLVTEYQKRRGRPYFTATF